MPCNAASATQDISEWDTSEVTDMHKNLVQTSAAGSLQSRPQRLGNWATRSRICGACSTTPRPLTKTSAAGRSTRYLNEALEGMFKAPRPSTRTSAGAWPTT